MTDNARRRSRERLEERERGILDAATTLFATAGFHATSTRKIAAAAGVSEGTVFHYFGSKNELMLCILDRFYNGVLNPRAAQILDTVMDTRARLRALALHHVNSLGADNALMMRLLQVYVGVDLEIHEQGEASPLRELNRSYVRHLDRIIMEGVERGDLRSELDVRALRDLFFGTLEYGMRTHMNRHGAQDWGRCVDALLEPLWQGLNNPKTATTNADRLTERLESACARVETAAARLEETPK